MKKLKKVKKGKPVKLVLTNRQVIQIIRAINFLESQTSVNPETLGELEREIRRQSAPKKSFGQRLLQKLGKKF